jgi:hypothetical protein
MLLVLLLILLEKIKRGWPLIFDMPYLLFCDISLFSFLGPISRIGLFILGSTAWCKSCQVNAECEL